MRENRLSGSEGGAILIQSSLPLSIVSPFGTGTEEFLPTERSRNLHNTLFSWTLLTVR